MKKTFIPIDNLPKLKGTDLSSISKTLEQTHCEKEEVVDRCQRFICISVKDDDSQIKAIEKHITNHNQILILHYDDIGIAWDFEYSNETLTFYVKGKLILPLGIYNRSFIPAAQDPRYLSCLHFSTAVELWKGRKINCGMDNYHNSSKPLQGVKLSEEINKKSISNVSNPSGFIIKLPLEKAEEKLKNKSLITKSSSGMRSKVVDEKTFMSWDLKRLKYIPTFFQKTVHGADVRTHVLPKTHYAVQVKEKSGIDFRYNKNSGFENINLPKCIQRLCARLLKMENLFIIGVDFVWDKESNHYHILESNPNPGWAGFHRAVGQEVNLVKDIVGDYNEKF